MKLRKLTALLMGTAMVASLLAGCGSSDSTDAAATTETEQTTDSTEQATDSTEQATDSTGRRRSRFLRKEGICRRRDH